MSNYLNFTLQDSFEFTGLWWLPEDPKEEIAGVLSYSSSEGIHLDLLGTFDSFPPDDSKLFEVDVINGVTSSGIVCTLFSAFQTGFNHSAPGFVSQRLGAELLILGHEFSSRDQLSFSKLRVSFDHLEDWVSPNLIRMEYQSEEGQPIRVTVSGRSETFLNEQVDAIDGYVTLLSEMTSNQESSAKYKLSYEAFFELEPASEAKFEQYQRWLFDIQRFLSLVMAERTYPRKIHGFLAAPDEDDLCAKLGVSLFYQISVPQVFRRVNHRDMLLTFDDLKEHLTVALQRWLSAEHGVRQAINLFSIVSENDQVDLDSRFISIIHALESYHRATAAGHYISQDEYQPFLKAMKNAIPKEIKGGHRKSLENKLYYGYQHSQRKRLKTLFETIGYDLQQLVTDNYRGFVDGVVDTRNYLVHRDESIKELALEWPEKLYAFSRLKMLTTILFLKYLGLEEGVIAVHISNNRKLQQFIGSLEEEE